MMPKKPHVVLIPMPAQGHVHPFMQLAQLLHSKGFYITFVNTEFNHGRLLRSKGLKTLKGLADFKFETISDGLPPSDRDATQDPVALCDSLRKLNCLKPLLELLAKLNSSSTSLGVPPVSYIISDGAMSFAIKAAESLGIPEIQFWTASACGLMGYLQFRELVSRGLTPLKDETYLSNGYLDTKLDWVPGMPNIRLKDLPSFVRTSDRNDVLFDYLKEESQNCLKANAIIFNTFDDLEQEVLHAISSMFPHIYTIGPLSMLCNQLVQETDEVKSLKLSLWKEDLESLEWLEKREPNSVLYVNFGCVTVMSEEYLREFAWGLVNSKHPFLWIIRPDIVMGEDKAVLPEEIVEEIKDRGKIVSWCPQDQVLLHPSIGGFLTHCGWNSILESLIGGVPMICWPFFAEQQTNCRYACETWEVGMELDGDVKREEVEKVVKELMEGEEGKKMRKNALKWKEKAEEATMVGGSSYKNFDRILKEVLHPLD